MVAPLSRVVRLAPLLVRQEIVTIFMAQGYSETDKKANGREKILASAMAILSSDFRTPASPKGIPGKTAPQRRRLTLLPPAVGEALLH